MAVLVVLAVVLAAAVARPVVHAAEVVAEVVLITVASIGGLVLIAAMAWAAWRVRRWRAIRAGAMSSCRLADRRAQAVSAPRRAAIEAAAPRISPAEFRDSSSGARAAAAAVTKPAAPDQVP